MKNNFIIATEPYLGIILSNICAMSGMTLDALHVLLSCAPCDPESVLWVLETVLLSFNK